MKKMLLVLLVSLFGLSFGDVGWWTKERIESFNGGKFDGHKITAIAYCDTEWEAQKLCEVYSFSRYKIGIETPDMDISEEMWVVVFLEYSDTGPKIAVYHYITHGPVEFYAIFW